MDDNREKLAEELMLHGLRSLLFDHDWIDTECMVGILDDDDIKLVKGKEVYNDYKKPIQ